jgi:hypothetical protein
MDFLSLIPFLGNLLDRIIPDPAAAAAAKLEVLKLQMNNDQVMAKAANDLVQSQLNINAVEAASPSLLVSGGRPFIIWVCGFAFAWQFVLSPMVTFVLAAIGHPVGALPVLDMGEMMPVLGGLLGLGSLRTFEKIKGVARS